LPVFRQPIELEEDLSNGRAEPEAVGEPRVEPYRIIFVYLNVNLITLTYAFPGGRVDGTMRLPGIALVVVLSLADRLSAGASG
jgi:hypothetical protein